MPERKFASTGDRTRNQLVMSPTPSPLSHPDGDFGKRENAGFPKILKSHSSAGLFKVSEKEIRRADATIMMFNDLIKSPFENIVGKGENAGNQHFLLFPQCFLPYQGGKSAF